MKLKILSLNIFRYYQDWETRKTKIINFIEEVKPDIVVLQECFDDSRYNKKGNNQGIQLNKELNFKNCVYSIAEKLKSEGGKLIGVPVYDGLCLLTNLSIIEHSDIKLKKAVDDRHDRIIQRIVLSKNNHELILFHTHFSNRDDWAKNHLEETINLAKKETGLPIIVGDLNIKVQENIMKIAGEDYDSSWFIKKYISFPSEGEAFDYVLLPKIGYIFENISCLGDCLSDHKALIAIISKKVSKSLQYVYFPLPPDPTESPPSSPLSAGALSPPEEFPPEEEDWLIIDVGGKTKQQILKRSLDYIIKDE